MMVKGYEDVHSRLLAENDILRERVSRINVELQEILNSRKEFLIRTRRIEMGEEYTDDLDLNYSNLINFKKELLNMPMDSVKIKFFEFFELNLSFFLKKNRLERKHWTFCRKILKDSRIS